MLDLAQSLLAIGLELRDTRRFLEHRTAVFGFRRKNLVDLALSHHRVGCRADARAHEKPLYVLQSAADLIDEILAAAVAVYAARDRHFVVFGTELLLAVGERDGNFAKTKGFARVGTIKHHVGKLRAAQRRRALLAKHPANGVGNIRFAASVRTHNGDHAGLKSEPGLVRKAFEAENIKLFQIHAYRSPM